PEGLFSNRDAGLEAGQGVAASGDEPPGKSGSGERTPVSDSGNFRRVEELYHAALARGRDERDLFLKEACGDDEGLLRDVRSLLGYEEAAKGLLEEPVAEAATQRLTVIYGTRLGPYEVGGLIGAGGMGEVYRARDTRLGREVALRVLPAHVAKDPEALARVAREARTLAG